MVAKYALAVLVLVLFAVALGVVAMGAMSGRGSLSGPSSATFHFLREISRICQVDPDATSPRLSESLPHGALIALKNGQ